jgi:hypothetical protein
VFSRILNAILPAYVYKTIFIMMKKSTKRFACLFTIIFTLCINSCKKDNANKSITGLANPDIALAKSWYDGHLSITARFHVSQGTGNTKPSLNSLIKPNWKYAVGYTRLGKQVIEIPIDSTNLLGVSLNKNFNFRKNPSKSAFLILNDGKNYEAYIMTILADSSYLQNDFSKLSRNSYAKRDKDFSGFVFYYTPAGQLLNGWHYSNGKLDKTVSAVTAQTGSAQIQTLQNSKVKTRATGCGTSTFFVYMGSGTVSFGDVSSITYFFDEYIFDSCDGENSFQQDPGGGGFAPPDGSGAPPDTPVDITITIKTDTLSQNYPCAVSLIIDGLLATKSYTDFVTPFITDRKPDLIWTDKDLPWNPINGSSTLGNTISAGGGGLSAIIILNNLMLQNSSQLLIAAAAVHETIHAYINNDVTTASTNQTPNFKINGSWLYSLDIFYDQNALPSNYRDHYEMLSDYFDQAVGTLGS